MKWLGKWKALNILGVHWGSEYKHFKRKKGK